MDADVAVIGVGPVGAALAMLLAGSGRRVAVVEKAVLPRDKPCGEGLLPSGAQVLARVGVDLGAEGFPAIRAVRYRLPGGRSVRGELRTGPGRGVRRLRLDALLAERAAATPGVEVATGCAALGVEAGRRLVRVATERGELRARVVVGADGLRSPLARWLGWARPPGGAPRHALVGHVTTPAGPALEEIAVTLLGDVEVYAAPSGAGELLVAVLGARGALRAPGRTVAESYLAIVERAHPELAGARLAGRVWGAGPFRTRPSQVAGGRAFLAGDAAGFLDPLTADGLSSGLAQAGTLAGLLGPGTDLGAASAAAGAAAAYRRWHARQWRRRRFVTGLALALTGSAALAGRAVSGAGRRPAALESLLEVNDGTRRLSSLGLRDWAALAGF
ncbi:MAG TPA: NAD(P)/FAD-dependent oxidoreductase [Candidatus Dormibacteraeota bacterium]|nr:NAD(P)/FAD-dependent oxidoreductase [Candidatus Dormibacteraeota bacterium]